jgi:hypothetical protein
MKNNSPFKKLYYYGISVFLIVVVLVLLSVVGIYDRMNGTHPYGYKTHNKWDTAHKQFVVWDTVVKPVYKVKETKSVTPVKIETPTPVLDTTK